MMKHFFFLFFLFFHFSLFSQTTPNETQTIIKENNFSTKDSVSLYRLSAQKTAAIRIDGRLDEQIWQNAQVVTGFTQNFPTDTLLALSQTKVQMAYDENYLYIAAICKGNPKQNYVISSMRRDFSWSRNDNFSINLDPFGDGLNGVYFAVSAVGAQLEGLIFEGDRASSDWDNKWYSAVSDLPDGSWTCEIAIPFKTLRYPKNKSKWKINFVRNDAHRNERSSWIPVPIQFSTVSLAFAGELTFEENIKKAGSNISIIPYLAGSATKDNINNTPYKTKGNIGGDAKIAVTPSLNLDLTVNPDFSQVEVDQQVTNLSRFEIFFPERRQFFLENSDLFANFGFSRMRPFFSRRIGIAKDTITGENVQNPILYGARLSGKVNKDWRVGLLNIQTGQDAEKGIIGNNYTVAAFQRQVFSRSNIAGIFVNRQETSSQNSDKPYTRMAGLEYNLQSEDSKWRGKIFYHHAFLPNKTKGTFAHAGFLAYNTRKFYASWNHELVGENYDINDIGYVRRKGLWRFEDWAGYNFYPKKGKIQKHNFHVYFNTYTDLNWKTTDRNISLEYNADLFNTSEMGAGFFNDYTYLFSSFDPTNSDGKEFEEGEKFTNTGGYFYFNSDSRKRLNASTSTSYRTYFTGTRFNIDGTIRYRFQPYGQFAISFDHNIIDLPEPYNDANFWIISPRLDVSFSRSLFLTTFLQYNTQADNVNLNARFQWRFKPVSDFFLVYSENYLPENFGSKNRAIVAKISYWFNL